MRASTYTARHTTRIAVLCLVLLSSAEARAQVIAPKTATTTALQEAPKDTLGRNTPKGTVLGFLSAARKGNAEIAALYLNTPLRGGDAAALARQLGVVLDRRLPAR